MGPIGNDNVDESVLMMSHYDNLDVDKIFTEKRVLRKRK